MATTSKQKSKGKGKAKQNSYNSILHTKFIWGWYTHGSTTTGYNFAKKKTTGYKARIRARLRAWLRVYYSRQRTLDAISFVLTAIYKRN